MRNLALVSMMIPAVLLAQAPAGLRHVTETVTLPKGFNNAWVVIEYSPSGATFSKEATYEVGPSGYLKVPNAAPKESSKLSIRIGDEPPFDGGISPRIQRAGRTGVGHVSVDGHRSNRSFLVFFVGSEVAIQDNWSRHIPK